MMVKLAAETAACDGYVQLEDEKTVLAADVDELKQR